MVRMTVPEDDWCQLYKDKEPPVLDIPLEELHSTLHAQQKKKDEWKLHKTTCESHEVMHGKQSTAQSGQRTQPAAEPRVLALQWRRLQYSTTSIP